MVRNTEFRYHRDLSRDGYLVYENDKTVKLYEELRYKTRYEGRDIFSAIDDESFNDGYKRLVKEGFINDGDKVKRYFDTSTFGTFEALKKLHTFQKGIFDRIASECDPMEVFVFEYNNYESMYGNIDEPLNVIESYWGRDERERISKMFGY